MRSPRSIAALALVLGFVGAWTLFATDLAGQSDFLPEGQSGVKVGAAAASFIGGIVSLYLWALMAGKDDARKGDRLVEEAATALGAARHGSRLAMALRRWEIVVDWTTEDVTWTSGTDSMGMTIRNTVLNSQYQSSRSFQFEVKPADWSARIRRRLGFERNAEVDIEDPQFNRRMRVQTDDPVRLQALLSDARLRDLVLSESFHELETGSPTADTCELRLRCSGHIRDPERLAQLRELMGRTPDGLVKIGVAEPP